MSKKTSLLIRDIARLFVEYRLEDWVSVLGQLRSGNVMQNEIAAAIDILILRAEESRKKVSKNRRSASGKRRSSRAVINLGQNISEERREILEPVRTAMIQKLLLPTMKSMRDIYHRLGIKRNVPANRAVAVDEVIRHLDGLSSSLLASSLEMVTDPDLSGAANLRDDYRRWFEVITKETK